MGSILTDCYDEARKKADTEPDTEMYDRLHFECEACAGTNTKTECHVTAEIGFVELWFDILCGDCGHFHEFRLTPDKVNGNRIREMETFKSEA